MHKKPKAIVRGYKIEDNEPPSSGGFVIIEIEQPETSDMIGRLGKEAVIIPIASSISYSLKIAFKDESDKDVTLDNALSEIGRPGTLVDIEKVLLLPIMAGNDFSIKMDTSLL